MWCSNWLRLVWPWENAAIVREDAKVVHLLFASCHFCTSNVCAHCRGRVFSKEPFFEPFPQILQPLRLRRGDCDDLHTGKTFSKGVEIFLGARQVHFVSNNAPGPLGKSRIVEVRSDCAAEIATTSTPGKRFRRASRFSWAPGKSILFPIMRQGRWESRGS